jgi:metal-responsive CopG/Arc/MetJ family transcriptional regulator
MSKDNRIVGYVDDSIMAEVDSITEQNNMSKSEYVSRAVTNQLERDKMGELAEKNTLEMKLLRMIDDATTTAADQLADEAAPKIAEAVAAELQGLDQHQQTQNTDQQQQQNDQQTDDSIESGLID